MLELDKGTHTEPYGLFDFLWDLQSAYVLYASIVCAESEKNLMRFTKRFVSIRSKDTRRKLTNSGRSLRGE